MSTCRSCGILSSRPRCSPGNWNLLRIHRTIAGGQRTRWIPPWIPTRPAGDDSRAHFHERPRQLMERRRRRRRREGTREHPRDGNDPGEVHLESSSSGTREREDPHSPATWHGVGIEKTSRRPREERGEKRERGGRGGGRGTERNGTREGERWMDPSGSANTPTGSREIRYSHFRPPFIPLVHFSSPLAPRSSRCVPSVTEYICDPSVTGYQSLVPLRPRIPDECGWISMCIDARRLGAPSPMT
jgi:hypothetical protein